MNSQKRPGHDGGHQSDDHEAADGRSRRRFVQGLGGLTGAALLGACGDDGDSTEAGAQSGTSSGSGTGASGGEGQGGSPGTGGAGGSPAGSGGSGGSGASGGTGPTECTLYPQQTAGPFYLDLDLVRSDITEGKPGTPLMLSILVLSDDGCTPIEGAAVEVWHNDALGVYSGFPNQLGGLDTTGQQFLRGTQITDAEGRVTFVTIYPGWYPGRTTHIHFRVHPTSTTQVTSQLYFPEDVTAAVYQTPPYDTHGPKNTSNAQDSLAQQGSPPLLAVTETQQGYAAELAVTVAALA